MKTKTLKFLMLISLFLSVQSCSTTSENGPCMNPDCEFENLTPPIRLYTKSFYTVTLVDSKNKIWVSSTEWDIARSIITEGYQIGDTIGK